MAPDLERLARTPWPIASLASSGIRPFSSVLAFCAREMHRGSSGIFRQTRPQELEAPMSTIRTASIRGRGGRWEKKVSAAGWSRHTSTFCSPQRRPRIEGFVAPIRPVALFDGDIFPEVRGVLSKIEMISIDDSNEQNSCQAVPFGGGNLSMIVMNLLRSRRVIRSSGILIISAKKSASRAEMPSSISSQRGRSSNLQSGTAGQISKTALDRPKLVTLERSGNARPRNFAVRSAKVNQMSHGGAEKNMFWNFSASVEPGRSDITSLRTMCAISSAKVCRSN